MEDVWLASGKPSSAWRPAGGSSSYVETQKYSYNCVRASVAPSVLDPDILLSTANINGWTWFMFYVRTIIQISVKIHTFIDLLGLIYGSGKTNAMSLIDSTEFVLTASKIHSKEEDTFQSRLLLIKKIYGLKHACRWLFVSTKLSVLMIQGTWICIFLNIICDGNVSKLWIRGMYGDGKYIA